MGHLACQHEWANESQEKETTHDDVLTINDVFGSMLKNGDSITVIKDLKIKGSSQVVKVGTKVKNIRLVHGDHNIDCKIDGIGPMKLKSEFVKKV
jgi:protein PhnA